jgi:hypothetical protein
MGLTIPSPVFTSFVDNSAGVSVCPSSSTVGYMTQLALRFGYDTSSGCMLPLTRYSPSNYTATCLTAML